jgi:tetratricopeptide (TPR) repeat protein
MKTSSLFKDFLVTDNSVTVHLTDLPADKKALLTYDNIRNIGLTALSTDTVNLAAADLCQSAETLNENPHLIVIRAAMLQTAAALHVAQDNLDRALDLYAKVMLLLSLEPDMKDETYLLVLGCTLYDLTYVHYLRKELKAAERTVSKAIKIFDRLAKKNPDRYAAAHIHAINAAQTVYKSRVKQANLLAHHQVATLTYLTQMNAGVQNATEQLIKSLQEQGETLMSIGKYRAASTSLSRALRYLKKLQDKEGFTREQLEMSVLLSRALLSSSSTRSKGVQLLNVLQPQAVKLKQPVIAAEIRDLLDKSSGKLDIIAIWHKIFAK